MAYKPVVEDLWKQLMASGMSQSQAAGVLGNVQQESNFNPNALNKKEGAEGLFQMREGRNMAMKAFAADNPQMGPAEAQTGHLLGEIAPGGSEARGAAAFNQSTDPREAAYNFDKGVERSAGTERGQRMDNAMNIYNAYAGGAKNSTPQGLEAIPGDRQGANTGIDWQQPGKAVDPTGALNASLAAGAEGGQINPNVVGYGGQQASGSDGASALGAGILNQFTGTNAQVAEKAGSLLGGENVASLMDAPDDTLLPSESAADAAPESILNDDGTMKQKEKGASGQLNYDDIVTDLNKNAHSEWRDRVGAGLMALSQSAGAMAHGKAADMGGIFRMAQGIGARRDAAMAQSESTASTAMTLTRMPGGEPYARALAGGADPKVIMPLYKQEQGHRFKNAEMNLENTWKVEAASIQREHEGGMQDERLGVQMRGQDLTADTAAAGQGVQMRGQDLTSEAAAANTAIAQQNADTKSAEFDLTSAQQEYDNAQDEDNLTAQRATGKALLDAAITAAKQQGNTELAAALKGVNPMSIDNEMLTAINDISQGLKSGSSNSETISYDRYLQDFVPTEAQPNPKTMQELKLEQNRANVANSPAALETFSARATIEREGAAMEKVNASYNRLEQMTNAMNQMDTLLSQGTDTGSFQAAAQPIMSMLASTGVLPDDVRQQVENGELFRGSAASLYAYYTEALKGAISDFEGKTLKDSGPQYDKLAGTNQAMIDTWRAAKERALGKGEYFEQNLGTTGANGKRKGEMTVNREWNEKVKNFDPDTAPAFFDASKMPKGSLAANVEAGNFGVGSMINTKDGWVKVDSPELLEVFIEYNSL